MSDAELVPGGDEDNMMEAVERLAEVLNREDFASVGEDGTDSETAELIGKIENQINRLMTADDEGYEQEDEKVGTSTKSRRRKKRGAHKKTSELPYYPTPYELWRKSHEVVDTPKKAPVLTETQWKEVVDRLNDSSKVRYVANMRAQHRLIAEELSSLSFQPKINEHSREIAHVAPLHERLTHILKLRHERLEKHRQKQMEREVSKLTGSPAINKNSNWTPRVRNVYTSRKHPDKDEGELTFSPQINARSRRLWKKAKARQQEQGGLSAAEIGKLRIDPNEGREEETFRPEINYRSRALAHRLGDGPAHERLYSMAKQKMYSAAREDVERVKTHWRRKSVEMKRAVRLRSPPRRGRVVEPRCLRRR